MSRAPIAIVSIVDDDRIWFKYHHGLDIAQIGRDPGLCASCVQQDGPWIVNDARTDPRALANPLIAGELGAQFLPLTRIGRGVTLDHLAARQLEPFVGEQATRVELEGPLLLSPMAAQNIGLALHELATNAVKYGAFSESRGKVRVIWHHAPPRLA
jgi:hypothetical protein